jgi:hypothetical protein
MLAEQGPELDPQQYRRKINLPQRQMFTALSGHNK